MVKRFTLSQLLVAVVGLALLVALAVPLLVHARRRARVAACAENLVELWRRTNVAAVRVGRRGPLPSHPPLGKEFWAQLATPGGSWDRGFNLPPVIGPEERRLLHCPFRPPVDPGEVHYLGPPAAVARLRSDDPVGADELSNHDRGRSGNVLRKSGDVLELEGESWREAARACWK